MTVADFEQNGFALIPGLLNADDCAGFAAAAAPALTALSGGTRNLLEEAWCAALANRLARHRELKPLLPDRAVAVQCTYFEKSASRNWLVPIHQDLSIPVAERVADASLGPWSTKEGTLFVQPPVALLEQLVAVRIHLDDCGAHDGLLRVVPGSHRAGVVAPQDAIAARAREVPCAVPQGDALVMRPLLLHSSSKTSGSGLRRVLHFLFGPAPLPLGLRWKQAVPVSTLDSLALS
jgi:hypothetical protein